MSFEEIYTLSATCPCGNGKITQKVYEDDWNRYEYSKVEIGCEACKKKYKIETETHRGMLASDGSWDTYYLTPKCYPDYVGVREDDVYPKAVNYYQDFIGWLIENYTLIQLKQVLEQLELTKSSSCLTGVAAYIREKHKKSSAGAVKELER